MINLLYPTQFTSGFLISDTYQGLGGSVDSLSSITKVGGVPVSACLELQSTLGGLVLPRMTTAQRLALEPVNGMMVYDSTINSVSTYEGGAWATTGTSGTVTSITAGANIVLSPSTITTTGSVALNPVLTGLTSAAIGDFSISGNTILATNTNGSISIVTNGTGGNILVATGGNIFTGTVNYSQGLTGFIDNVNVLSSAATTYQILSTDSMLIPNTTTNAITLYVPPAVQGATVRILDGFGLAGTHNISLTGGTVNGTGPSLNATPVPVSGLPGEPVFTPDSTKLWILDTNATHAAAYQIQAANTTSPTLYGTTLVTGTAPQNMVIEYGGTYGFISAASTSSGTKPITLITNVSSTTPTASTLSSGLPTTANWIALSPGLNTVAMVTTSSSTLYTYTGATLGGLTALNTVTLTSATSASLIWYAPGGVYAYVYGNTGGTNNLYVIQHASNVGGSPSLATILLGYNVTDLVFTPNGNYIYLISTSTNNVTVIQNASSATPSFLTNLSLTGCTGTLNLAVTPDGNYVYVIGATSSAGAAWQISGASSGTPTVTNQIAISTNPVSIAVSLLGQVAYVAHELSSGVVTVLQGVDTPNPSVMKTFSVGIDPDAVIVSPAGAYAYCIDYGNGATGGVYQIQNAAAAYGALISSNYGEKTLIYNGTQWNVF